MVRLRTANTLSAAVGLVAVMAMVGALFPAVGHTIGKLNVPSSVATLLGGADYGTITGWFRSEIAVIYGPLVIAALAITAATAATAGEEEDRILALVLAHPVRRSRLVAAKAVAVALIVLAVAFAVWPGLIVGVAAGGGGITLAHITACSSRSSGSRPARWDWLSGPARDAAASPTAVPRQSWCSAGS
jgi:ABC-2 type transport system permease protein